MRWHERSATVAPAGLEATRHTVGQCTIEYVTLKGCQTSSRSLGMFIGRMVFLRVNQCKHLRLETLSERSKCGSRCLTKSRNSGEFAHD